MRLHHFTLSSDAFIAVPGGIGRVLEVRNSMGFTV
jgi:predicted Rossmann-fold nucleotide-binding protein